MFVEIIFSKFNQIKMWFIIDFFLVVSFLNPFEFTLNSYDTSGFSFRIRKSSSINFISSCISVTEKKMFTIAMFSFFSCLFTTDQIISILRRDGDRPLKLGALGTGRRNIDLKKVQGREGGLVIVNKFSY